MRLSPRTPSRPAAAKRSSAGCGISRCVFDACAALVGVAHGVPVAPIDIRSPVHGAALTECVALIGDICALRIRLVSNPREREALIAAKRASICTALDL